MFILYHLNMYQLLIPTRCIRCCIPMSTIMDYFTTSYFRLFFISLIILCLSACETELPNKPLEILGVPSGRMYYGSEFTYTFGATGGEGVYSYRYINNPNIENEDRTNLVELEITDEIQGSQPTFVLHGIPLPPEGVELEDAASGSIFYGIEITDGVNTEVQEYKAIIAVNSVKIDPAIKSATEGSSNFRSYNNLVSSRSTGSQTVCESIEKSAYGEHVNGDGYAVSPNTFQVFLDAVVTSETTVYLKFVSGYDENFSEDSRNNAGKARPGVDYLDEELSITFLPGERSCDASLNILDDNKFEGTESLKVVVTDVKGGYTEVTGESTQLIEIKDNEPEPIITSEDVTKNQGDTVLIPVKLTTAANYPLDIIFSIDENITTLDVSEYELFPESGVVTFKAGEVESLLSVTLKQTGKNLSPQADKLLAIKSNIDRELTKISVNQWPLGGNISNEIVVTENTGSDGVTNTVLDMVIEGGIITLLVSEDVDPTAPTPESSAFIKTYNIDGTKLNFEDNTNEYHFPNTSVKLTPISIASDKDNLVVIFEVDGLYTGVHRGGVDFVVSIFSKTESSQYKQTITKQFGTEGDDLVSGVKISGSDIYVYGQTDGLEFDGAGGSETNKGSTDGFVYKLALNANFVWSRFIGTSDADMVVSLDAGLSEVSILTKRETTDIDAFVRRVAADSGYDVVGVDDSQIRSIRNDIPTMILYKENKIDSLALFKSRSLLPGNDLTTTSTDDIHVLNVGALNVAREGVVLSTAGEDEPVGMVSLNEESRNSGENTTTVVYGNTLGVFEDNTRKSLNSSDAFVAIIEGSDISALSQFGTVKENKVISAKEVNAYKFMVLWSEDFTSGDGSLRYRISAFSSKGDKLSLDPVNESLDISLELN